MPDTRLLSKEVLKAFSNLAGFPTRKSGQRIFFCQPTVRDRSSLDRCQSAREHEVGR
jgi:hypothetical protein